MNLVLQNDYIKVSWGSNSIIKTLIFNDYQALLMTILIRLMVFFLKGLLLDITIPLLLALKL